jgi:cytochrome P450
MDAETRDDISSYSFLDPATQSDPFPFYKKLHANCPVYQMPETGFFVATKYDDVREVVRDTDTYTSNVVAFSAFQGDVANVQEDLLKEKGWAHVATLQRTDPPVHSRYRTLLNRVFTGPQVDLLAPRIETLVNELIDKFIDKGECEFVSEFALPLPGIIIAEQIGLDPKDILTFKKWADAMLAGAQRPLTPEETLAAAETELEAQLHLAKVFEDRSKNPQDDIMSGLVHAHGEDEEPFTMHELQNLMHQLITGGYETVTSGLSRGAWLMVRYPEVAQRLRDDPSLADRFVEESLRFESPVQGLFRQTTCDAELNGTTIPKGSVVIARFGAANRDEEQFANSDDFDIDREKLMTHIAFGAGVHRCVGQVLARAELRFAYRTLVQRLKNIELARPLPDPVNEPSIFLFPMKELYLKFDKNV